MHRRSQCTQLAVRFDWRGDGQTGLDVQPDLPVRRLPHSPRLRYQQPDRRADKKARQLVWYFTTACIAERSST